MNLVKIKNEKFGMVDVDFFKNEVGDIFMTAEQLGQALGYKNPQISILKMTNRNEYLKDSKFSVLTKLGSTDGKTYQTRVFNEDGIYEVAFKSNTTMAFEFRDWVRNILKALRKGEFKNTNTVDIVIQLNMLRDEIKSLKTGQEKKKLEEKKTEKTNQERISALHNILFKYAQANGLEEEWVWDDLFNEFEMETGISLKRVYRNMGKNSIDFIIEHNFLELLEFHARVKFTRKMNGKYYILSMMEV